MDVHSKQKILDLLDLVYEEMDAHKLEQTQDIYEDFTDGEVLDLVYENVFGDDASSRYSVEELVDRLGEMYDAYQTLQKISYKKMYDAYQTIQKQKNDLEELGYVPLSSFLEQ
jgi:hypothetical protein